MDRQINYDFNLSSSVTENLEEIAAAIENGIIRCSADDLALMSDAWQSDAAESFILKYKKLLDEIKKTENEIIAEAEEISRISRHMFLIEQEAKRIAAEEGHKG